MIDLIYVIFMAVAIGFTVSFMIILSNKWEILDYYEMIRKKWMPERCEFCLSFWLSALLFVVFIWIIPEELKFIHLFSIPMATVIAKITL
jgi:hypothetical protein